MTQSESDQTTTKVHVQLLSPQADGPCARELTTGELRRYCNPEDLNFETTAELSGSTSHPGQDRAIAAINFGVDIDHRDYNIFALGGPSLGKQEIITSLIEEKAKSGPAPDDWCYVYNFEDENKPIALRFDTGDGAVFASEVENLVRELRSAIPAAFEGSDFQEQRQVILDDVKSRREKSFRKVQEEAERNELGLIQSPNAVLITPMRAGKSVDPAEFEKWPEAEKKKVRADTKKVQELLSEHLENIPKWERTANTAIRALADQVTKLAITHLVDEMGEKYAYHADAAAYIASFKTDVTRNANAFLELHAQTSQVGLSDESIELPAFFSRYEVNLFVGGKHNSGRPIIYEDNPTFQNLVGAIEYRSQFGNLITDFTLLRPGALHRANGGYLILRAADLLRQPFAYDSLKRALRANAVKLESLSRALSIVSTISLEPAIIPLDLKVILIGDRDSFEILSRFDADFDQFFKVSADFSEDIKRNSENERRVVHLIADIAKVEKLRPVHKSAVASVIDEASRLVSASDRLSVHRDELAKLLCEGNHIAGKNGRREIRVEDIEAAKNAKIYRADQTRERLQQMIADETLMIDVAGNKVGQINGLAAAIQSRFAFAFPVRITATARPGRGDIVDIEREAELGGPIHSKGVMILECFLANRYARNAPLSLSASLVFEQSHGHIEGDSASAAELLALLSAISGAPLKQAIAVTGSVNQHGELQAVGAVNEKIEGYFDTCKTLGITRDQGVLIPSANIKNLMLREDVVNAAEEGAFHVFAASNIDEAMSILSETNAGAEATDGTYPVNTFNRRVNDQLLAFAEALRQYGAAAADE